MNFANLKSPVLIFDCDGVLIDSERILNQVFRECLEMVGLQLSFEETIRRFKGRSTTECIGIAERLLGQPLDVELVNSLYESKGKERLLTQLQPIGGIVEALQRLPYRKCVASNSSQDYILTGLGLTGLTSYFSEGIFSASEVKLGKPAPDLFLHAASKLKVAPSDCVVIEDSVVGVQAAIAAKMTVFGFVDLTPEEELKNAGASTFHKMTELPDLLDNYVLNRPTA
ncbi:MAG: HAD family phosphatase [Bdellovibrionales bacterium]|nr:HAD family phosphatase [Bdellovibrionales bacterium]